MRVPLPGLLVAAALVPVGCGGGGSNAETTAAGTGTTTAAQAPSFVATLNAPTHQPVANAAWPITISARTFGGVPLRATVTYEYLFTGQVVARRSRYRFTGTFHDVIRWPTRSLSFPLTFRAVVTTRLGTQNLDYQVQVKAR